MSVTHQYGCQRGWNHEGEHWTRERRFEWASRLDVAIHYLRGCRPKDSPLYLLKWLRFVLLGGVR